MSTTRHVLEMIASKLLLNIPHAYPIAYLQTEDPGVYYGSSDLFLFLLVLSLPCQMIVPLLPLPRGVSVYESPTGK